MDDRRLCILLMPDNGFTRTRSRDDWWDLVLSRLEEYGSVPDDLKFKSTVSDPANYTFEVLLWSMEFESVPIGENIPEYKNRPRPKPKPRPYKEGVKVLCKSIHSMQGTIAVRV